MRLECEHCGWKGDFQEADIKERGFRNVAINCPKCKYGVSIGVHVSETRTIVCGAHADDGWSMPEEPQ